MKRIPLHHKQAMAGKMGDRRQPIGRILSDETMPKSRNRGKFEVRTLSNGLVAVCDTLAEAQAKASNYFKNWHYDVKPDIELQEWTPEAEDELWAQLERDGYV